VQEPSEAPSGSALPTSYDQVQEPSSAPTGSAVPSNLPTYASRRALEAQRSSFVSGSSLKAYNNENAKFTKSHEKNLFESNCVKESKLLDIQKVPVDKCVAPSVESPVNIESQDGQTITFSISQVWKGCDANNLKLDWMAVDYQSDREELECAKLENVKCGKTETFTASCNDGVAIVDLYSHDKTVFAQEDGSQVMIPTACGIASEGHSTCHFRYLIKCLPSKCAEEKSIGRRLRGARDSLISQLYDFFFN